MSRSHRRSSDDAVNPRSPTTCSPSAIGSLALLKPRRGTSLTRRRGPSKVLCGEDGSALRLLHKRTAHLPDRHGDREGRLCRELPVPDELWAKLRKAEPLARPLRRRPFRGRGGTWHTRYYQDIAIERALEAIAAGKQRILLTLATGTGKTFIAFQIAWKLFQSRWNLKPRAVAAPAHPLPRRPQHPRRPGVQRFLGVPRGRAGADQPGRDPQEGTGARRTAASSSPSSRPS